MNIKPPRDSFGLSFRLGLAILMQLNEGGHASVHFGLLLLIRYTFLHKIVHKHLNYIYAVDKHFSMPNMDIYTCCKERKLSFGTKYILKQAY